jgi:hypothetical protein
VFLFLRPRCSLLTGLLLVCLGGGLMLLDHYRRPAGLAGTILTGALWGTVLSCLLYKGVELVRSGR